MKLFAFAALVADKVSNAQDEKKVPPRHPLERLDRLVEFSAELLDDWYAFLPSRDAWKNKFEINAARMASNFQRGNQRCGFYDPSIEHGGPPPSRKRRQVLDENERYNRNDPSEGTRQITTGFRKWAERYLSLCSGQKKYSYQVNRMEKWNIVLQAKLAANNSNQ